MSALGLDALAAARGCIFSNVSPSTRSRRSFIFTARITSVAKIKRGGEKRKEESDRGTGRGSQDAGNYMATTARVPLQRTAEDRRCFVAARDGHTCRGARSRARIREKSRLWIFPRAETASDRANRSGRSKNRSVLKCNRAL